MQESRFVLIQHAAVDALDDDSGSHSRSLICTRLEVLESNWSKFQAEHEHICLENLDNTQGQAYVKNRVYERCQEFYVQARSALLNRKEEIESSMPSSRASEASTPTATSTRHQMHLPRISLPVFSGDYASWGSFYDLFLSMVVNNASLNNVEKMHYLKTCLSGDAARRVINLPVSEDTFSIAWAALIARYENKRVLISAQLDKLLSIKPIKTKSAEELSSLLTTVTESLGALQALDCQITSWDPLLIHLLNRLLDAETREDWEVHLGSSTVYPTLQQFEEFLVGRIRAWESLKAHAAGASGGKDRNPRSVHKSELRSRSLVAATPNFDGKIACRYCNADHFMSACPEYLALSAQRRRQMVIKKKLCFNCLGNHASNRCSSGRRCRQCGQKHHTSIHGSFKVPPSSSKAQELNKENVAPMISTQPASNSK